MKRFVWLLVAGLTVLLVACAEGEEVAVNMAVPTPPPTIEPTATETAVPTPPPTIEPTITETAVPVPTVTPLPTATLIPQDPFLRPTSLPTVAFEAGEEYQLVQPPFKSLLEVMRRGAEFEDIHLDEYGGHSPYLSINRLIESDVNSYYSDPFPDLEALLSDVSLRSYYFGWYQPSELHLYLLENGFHQYLNQKQPELKTGEVIEEEGFRLTPYSMQLDEDSTPEWLIQFESLVFQARIFLLFDQTENGQYELIPSSLPTLLGRSYSDGWVELIVDKDFTGDGINEIVIDSTTVWSGFTERTWDLFTWDGELINLDQIVDTSHADFEIADRDDDGLNDVQVTTHYSSRFSCAWEAVDLYRWPNQIAQHTLSDHEEPDTAVCNLSLATNLFSLSWNPEKDDIFCRNNHEIAV